MVRARVSFVIVVREDLKAKIVDLLYRSRQLLAYPLRMSLNKRSTVCSWEVTCLIGHIL